MRRAVSLVAVLLLGSIGATATADNANEACFRRRTNETRKAEDARTLTVSAKIDEIARAHATRMAADETIYHNTGTGADDDGVGLKEESPPFAALGENVGMGGSCDAIFEAFLDSPPHFANIVDDDYRRLGVGVVVAEDGTLYVVLDFFTPASKPPTTPPEGKCP